MSRTVGASGARTAEAIRVAGLQLIYEHGFEAMSLRQLAVMVGLQPASLYNHMATKQDLLFRIIFQHMRDLIDSTHAALDADSDATALDRLRRFIAHHLHAHMQKKREVYVANFELRALTAPNYESIVAMREQYERILIDILDCGVAEGSLRPIDTPVAAYALLAMLTGTCTWYKPNGRLSEGQVIAMHTALVLDGYATPTKTVLAEALPAKAGPGRAGRPARRQDALPVPARTVKERRR